MPIADVGQSPSEEAAVCPVQGAIRKALRRPLPVCCHECLPCTPHMLSRAAADFTVLQQLQ